MKRLFYFRQINSSRGEVRLQIDSKAGVAWLTVPCIAIVALFFLVGSVSLASAIKVVPDDKLQTCYDYAVNFSATHPDWGCVTISQNKYFKGISHMVNYQVLVGGGLLIHDGMNNADYATYGWRNCNQFYHFWLCTRPVRNYLFLQDNSQLIR